MLWVWGNIQSNNSPAGNIYGGVSLAGILDALRLNQSTPDPKTAKDMRVVGCSGSTVASRCQFPRPSLWFLRFPLKLPVQILFQFQRLQIMLWSFAIDADWERFHGPSYGLQLKPREPKQGQKVQSSQININIPETNLWKDQRFWINILLGYHRFRCKRPTAPDKSRPGSLQRQTDQAKGCSTECWKHISSRRRWRQFRQNQILQTGSNAEYFPGWCWGDPNEGTE